MRRISLIAVAAFGAACLAGAASVQAQIINENFESYSTTGDMLAVWPGGPATLDTANGNPGKSAFHPGGVVNARTFTAVNPTNATPLTLSVDIFDDGTSANKRITTGLRAGASNIVELGMFNAPAHYAFRLINFTSGNPNWVAFDTVGQSGVPNSPAVRWNRFTASIGDTTTTFTLDLGANGSIDATHVVNAVPAAAGFTELRFGGPSGLTSAGGGANFDNILLQSIPEPASLSLLGIGAATLLVRRRR